MPKKKAPPTLMDRTAEIDTQAAASVLSDPLVVKFVDLVRAQSTTRDEAIALITQYGSVREIDGMALVTNDHVRNAYASLNSVAAANAPGNPSLRVEQSSEPDSRS